MSALVDTVGAVARPSPGELLREYERLQAWGAEDPGCRRVTTFGWDLEFRSLDTVLMFIDQILVRGVNDFRARTGSPVILDCGANIGFTALYYKRLYPDARIIAFEPDPEFLPLLRANLLRNDAHDVRVVPAAAWTGDGNAAWILEGNDGSRLGAAGSEQRGTTVATVDLRRYLSAPVDLVKLDIEGAEFDVVPHLARELGLVRTIIVECHLIDQSKYVAFGRVVAALKEAGFSISINSSGAWRDLTRRHVPAPLHAEQYLTIYGWRDDDQPTSTEESFVPYVGISHCRELRRVAQLDAAERHNAESGRLLAAFVGDPSRPAAHQLTGPILRERGHCWHYRLPASLPLGDTADGPHAVTVVLEDERALGPAHAGHDDIRYTGRGLYSHWGGALYFSTSDNSDPNTNGRRYTLVSLQGSAS